MERNGFESRVNSSSGGQIDEQSKDRIAATSKTDSACIHRIFVKGSAE
jgi:hypothetical protein